MRKAVIITAPFDPVSGHHISLAKSLLKEGKADAVFFRPEEGEHYKERCRMITQAVQPYRKIMPYDKRKAKEYSVTEIIGIAAADLHEADPIMVRWPCISRRNRRFIMENGLYRMELAGAQVSEKRFRHMQQVAQLSAELAPSLGIDPEQAYTAGLFHDIAKYMDEDLLEKYMDIYDPGFKALNRPLWHQFAGAHYMSRCLKMSDRSVLKAIRHHATGDDKAPLSMLIYCMDKLDPSRGYDSRETIELCRRDLKAGFDEVHRQQQEYLKKEGII